MNYLRDLIKSNSYIYPIYINKIRRLGIDFPNKSTDLHLTGFPRSANTYCKQLVNEVFPELNTVTHIHTVASLKIALKNNTKVILLLRSPLSTTTSLMMKYDYKTVCSVLYDYMKYHEYVVQNKEAIDIFTFEEVISSPYNLINFIKSNFNVGITDQEIKSRLNSAEQKFKQKEKSKNPLGSSLPNYKREEKKDSYTTLICSHRLYGKAQNLYLELKK